MASATDMDLAEAMLPYLGDDLQFDPEGKAGQRWVLNGSVTSTVNAAIWYGSLAQKLFGKEERFVRAIRRARNVSTMYGIMSALQVLLLNGVGAEEETGVAF